MSRKLNLTPEEKRERRRQSDRKKHGKKIVRRKALRFDGSFNSSHRVNGDTKILALFNSGMPVVDIVIRLNIPASRVMLALERNP